MLNRKELRFERRSILTATQLRAIEKFPREFLRLMFSDYGDGIISGLNFVERGKEIFLTEGLVKIGDAFFFAEEINLSKLTAETRSGIWYKFCLSEPQRKAYENVISEKISLEVKSLEENIGGLEFGRFKAGVSIKLPSPDEEDTFEEFTRASRLNLLKVPCSIRGGVTFHPQIFQAILSRLQRKEKHDSADLALMIQLANLGAVTFDALKIFVRSKDIKWRDDSRENIFKSVIEAVDALREIILPEKFSAPEKIPKPKPTYEGIFIENMYD